MSRGFLKKSEKGVGETGGRLFAPKSDGGNRIKDGAKGGAGGGGEAGSALTFIGAGDIMEAKNRAGIEKKERGKL